MSAKEAREKAEAEAIAMAMAEAEAEDDDELEDGEGEEAPSDAGPKPPITSTDSSNLYSAIDETKIALDLFMNNEFDNARDMLDKKVGKSVYHTLGVAILQFLVATVTYEKDHINNAKVALGRTFDLCELQRKRKSVIERVKKKSSSYYARYSLEEAHAELCTAESQLLAGLLTVMEDETLTSLLKALRRVKVCSMTYRDCKGMMTAVHWANEKDKQYYESGVRFGWGVLNLMLSFLPSRVQSILKLLKFPGSKLIGLKELCTCYTIELGPRHIMCALAFLGYNLIVLYVWTRSEGDLGLCEEMISKALASHPNGVFFLYFKGRLEFVQGNVKESIQWYTKSWKSQTIWPRFHNFCFWELMWAHALQQDWEGAAKFADLLMNNSDWSRCTYMYHKAAFMMMKTEKLTAEEKAEVDKLMQFVRSPRGCGGTTISIERFCYTKAVRYESQQGKLVLPGIELVFISNLFGVFRKNAELGLSFHETIIDTESNLDPEGPYSIDNSALLFTLKGACLQIMGKTMQAKKVLKDVAALKAVVMYDTYLIPFALVELGIIYRDSGDKDNAIRVLKEAAHCSDYVMEPRLQFQIHSILQELIRERYSLKNIFSSQTNRQVTHTGT